MNRNHLNMPAKFEHEVFYSIVVHIGSMSDVLCRVAVEKHFPTESRVILRELGNFTLLNLYYSLTHSLTSRSLPQIQIEKVVHSVQQIKYWCLSREEVLF